MIMRIRWSTPVSEVVLDKVSKRFGATQAVSDLSLTIEDGAFVVLLGPTGAGKTTTLRLVAGLERPDGGQIRIAGQDVTRAPAGGARRRFRLPAIFALSASFGVRQSGLPVALSGEADAGAEDLPEGERSRGAAAHRRQARAAGDQTVRGSDAARGHRPRPRSLAVHLPHGRAPVVAGRQVARRIADRAQTHPKRTRSDDPLRHPRPDGGHDHGQPGRRR